MRKYSRVVLVIATLALAACNGVRRTYTIVAKAEKIELNYKDSLQQFNPLNK